MPKTKWGVSGHRQVHGFDRACSTNYSLLMFVTGMLKGNPMQGICQNQHYRMAAELVATEDDHSKQLICWKVKMTFVFALFTLSCLQISVIDFFKSNSKKTNISLTGQVWGEGDRDGEERCVQGRQLFLRVVGLPGNERGSLRAKKGIELLLSSGGPSASLQEVCGMGGLLPQCWRAGNFKKILQGGTLSGSRAEVFMLFGVWRDQRVGSGYGKIVFGISCYHFSLALWEGLRLFQKFAAHADLHLQHAERSTSLLPGMVALLGERRLSGPGEGNSPVSSSALSSVEEFHRDTCLSYPSHTKLPAPIFSTREAVKRKRLLVQAGASPSLPPLRADSERPLMWDSQRDPGLGWSKVRQGLNVGECPPRPLSGMN